MISFDPRKKAIIWVIFSFILFLFFLDAADFSFEQFKKGSISDSILAIVVVTVLCAVGGFIGLAILDKILSLIKSGNKLLHKDLKDEKSLSGEEKEYSEIITYWGGVIEGVTKLENGDKFDSFTFYNKKHLKYSSKKIMNALVWNAIKYGGKHPAIYQSCEATVMFLGNFALKIKDKQATQASKVATVITKYPTAETEKDPKKFDLLIDDIASIKENKKYTGKKLNTLQLEYVAGFQANVKSVLKEIKKRQK